MKGSVLLCIGTNIWKTRYFADHSLHAYLAICIRTNKIARIILLYYTDVPIGHRRRSTWVLFIYRRNALFHQENYFQNHKQTADNNFYALLTCEYRIRAIYYIIWNYIHYSVCPHLLLTSSFIPWYSSRSIIANHCRYLMCNPWNIFTL